MLISPAFAQSQAVPAVGGEFIITLMPFVLIFVIMYFLMIRPQQKRAKRHQEMVNNVRRGDSVITKGGLIGKVSKVGDDNEITIEIAEGTKVKVIKSMLETVRSKTKPVSNDN